MIHITIYTSKNCLYSEEAKKFLQKKRITFSEIDVTGNKAKQAEMTLKSSRRNTPQIFSAHQHIGGYADLVAYSSNAFPENTAHFFLARHVLREQKPVTQY